MTKVDNRIPVTTEAGDRLRALKQQDQTYEQLIRVMAAVYEKLDHDAVQGMSGSDRIKARSAGLTPMEYVMDVDGSGSVQTGDVAGGGTTDTAGGIDHFVHSYYPDIERVYRKRIYKLGV